MSLSDPHHPFTAPSQLPPRQIEADDRPVDGGYCPECCLGWSACRCNDPRDAVEHLRAVVAAFGAIPNNVLVPRHVWDTVNAAEDYVRRHHEV